MDSEGGGSNPAIDKLLRDEPYRFEFFQAVRLLERLLPDRLPVGRVNEEGQVILPEREIARFRTIVSLFFPPSQIGRLEHAPEGESDAQPQMEVAFMGLTGPLGALPNHYTELLIDR